MADVVLDPTMVVNPRVLEIVIPNTLAGDDKQVANRLFIFTGIAALKFWIPIGSDDTIKETATLDVSSLPGHPVFNGSPLTFITVPDPANPAALILKAATVASPAHIHWDENAEHATWAVEAAEAIDVNDHLVLQLNLAVAGDSCGLESMSYQINLLAHAQ